MARCTVTATFSIHLAWWLKVYIGTIIMIGRLTHMEPNMERVTYWLNKGVKVKFVREEGIGGA